MPRESTRCASIGCAAPSIRHIICLDKATETGAVFSAISLASARAAANNSSPGCTLRTRPASSASLAPKTRPVYTHSAAWLMPTSRGRNHEEHASGTMPRRANTNPKRAASEAKRISIGKVIVTPTPTAAPLIAPITGLVHSKIRSDTRPPPSRGTPTRVCTSLPPPLNVSPPPERSAPAQNPRPAPVTMTTRTSSSASTRSNASINSRIIVLVNALSLSGRFSVMVAMWSATS